MINGGYNQGRIIPALMFGYGCFYLLEHTGPLMRGNEINSASAFLWFFIVLCGSAALSDGLHILSGLTEWIRAIKPTGLKGTARFIKSLKELKGDLIPNGWGPYWGTFGKWIFRKEVMADFASNALVIGTAGSGKGVGLVQMNALTIHGNKVIIDFKGENYCCLASVLRERGENVIALNLGDVFEEIIGKSDQYNPLCILAQNFWRMGGLQDISDDLYELNMQLYPEPSAQEGKDGDSYFRNGSREDMAFAELMSVLLYGADANLGDVASLLSNRKKLLWHAQWACGTLPSSKNEGTYSKIDFSCLPWIDLHDKEDIENFKEYFSDLGSKVADRLEKSGTKSSSDSFLTGAQQSLERFNKTTRAYKKTKGSTFKFSDLKESDKPTTIFIILDASRIEAQAPVVSLLQWCMFTELKRHENKKRPVYLIADEATNFNIQGMSDASLLTWGRAYGLRLIIILQSLAAFKKSYGADAQSTLLSETEIKIFLPHQRDPETLRLIKELLADASIIARGRRGNRDKRWFGVDGVDYREEARPLMTEDEIRRTDKGILFIRRNWPMLVDLPPIGAVEPFRSTIDINPFHGKPFLLPIKLHLKRDQTTLFNRIKNFCKSPFNARENQK